MKNQKKLIQSVWPLPGGSARYLDTLIAALSWAASVESSSRSGFTHWMATQYNAEKSAGGYLQVILRLGALEGKKNWST